MLLTPAFGSLVMLDAEVQDFTEHVSGDICMPVAGSEEAEPGARDIIFKGGFDALNRFFHANELSDGPSIVPPTGQKDEAFLRFTDCDPDESLGILLSDSRAATIWSIVVYGVMAGRRPEYVSILVALVEAMCDPDYGVEHSGNTPGG